MLETKHMEVYLPIPFEGYEKVKSSREEAEGRWKLLKKYMGDIKGKTLLDLCCANGFFSFRFLQDGGKQAIGVEKKPDVLKFNRGIADEQGMNFLCYEDIQSIRGVFDFGFYLDTHYIEGTEDYLEFMAEHCRMCFISPSGNPKRVEERNKRIAEDLPKLFGKVRKIGTWFAGRDIYQCV